MTQLPFEKLTQYVENNHLSNKGSHNHFIKVCFDFKSDEKTVHFLNII
jgi:hypothetical protein